MNFIPLYPNRNFEFMDFEFGFVISNPKNPRLLNFKQVVGIGKKYASRA